MAKRRRKRRRRVNHPDRAVRAFLSGKLPFKVREQDAIAAIKHGATLEIRPGKLDGTFTWTICYPSGGHIFTAWTSYGSIQVVVERLCGLLDEWLPDVPIVTATRLEIVRTDTGGTRAVEHRYRLRDNARQLEVITPPRGSDAHERTDTATSTEPTASA